MRPPRIAILALFFAACVFLLCRAVVATAQPTVPAAPSSRSTAETSPFRSLFSFSAPFTLFPPNAIITIADDNSTSFAARPAAFGPPLPTKGLVGELWVGSGFTEETFQDGEGEGELGCSDVPGWDGNAYSNAVLKPSTKDTATDKSKSKSTAATLQSKVQKRSFSKRFAGTSRAIPVSEPRSKSRSANDGTDDYLHQRLSHSSTSHRDGFGLSGSAHADIQSIQEGAEIANKIVLLSRGGCGFLEKVKWAQRRGAIGVIVGDNQRGGPLIQMFAHGDTSNVTIPSIFTSRTTAYLLSLMMQPGSFIEDIVDENGKPSMSVQQQSERSRKAKKARQSSAPSTLVARGAAGSKTLSSSTQADPRRQGTDPANSGNTRSGWFGRLFNWDSKSVSVAGRTSTTGKVDWVLVEDFSDEKDRIIKNGLKNASKGNADKSKPPADNFQIGVEDWRDPDLVGPVDDEDDEGLNSATDRSRLQTKSSKTSSVDRSGGKMKPGTNSFKGSSKTSGTGEYTANGVPAKDRDMFDSAKGKSATTSNDNGGILSKLFGGSEEDSDQEASNTAAQPVPINTPIARPLPGEDPPAPHDPHDEEGLRVVITPSSGASPFFDTLLVLVISPLITLTVVYALLILRARIRRRRWRAPKSVVDRLPVRTYHTVATSSQSSRIPSPTSSSPTTPLLQGQRSSQGPRPRSRTTTSVPSTGDHLQVDTSPTPPRTPSRGSPPRAEHEKRGSEWKKYMGRQVECAVCLEEYVDGVSQVMSLPCGHEFHVDCITPWLTTRRRTCPICKGDVVRSLARGSPSSPRYEPYHDDDSDDEDAAPQGSSSPEPPTPRADEDPDADVERGVLIDAPHDSRSDTQTDGWLGTFSNSLRLWQSSRSEGQAQQDVDSRDR